MKILLMVALLCIHSIQAAVIERINNYTSPKGVNDVEFMEDLVWIATSGGLFKYYKSTGFSYQRPCNTTFPDPEITSLMYDKNVRLWVGSRDGYLLRVNPTGEEYVNTSYNSAKWQINDIFTYGDYLLVGSDRGFSIFDTRKNIVIKNASKIADFPSPFVNTINVNGKTLYLGCENGAVKLDGNLDKLEDINFYNPSIWKKIDTVSYEVKSILIDSGEVRFGKTLTDIYNGLLVTADSSTFSLHTDPVVEIPLPSDITFLKVKNSLQCWIGTEKDFVYYLNGNEFKQITLPGPTFSGVNKIHVDRTSRLWVLSHGLDMNVNYTLKPWWLGINLFDGGEWKNFGPKEFPEMGHMGMTPSAYGILEAQNGDMWFGFEGGSIKRCIPSKNDWTQYCNFGKNGDGDGAFIKTKSGACPSFDWAKCDAIAQDGSGYLWFSSWNNSAGCLLCYKPDSLENDSLTGRYRRFPPLGRNDPPVEITAIGVDSYQNIIFGTSQGKLTVVKHSGNPVKDGIQPVDEFENLKRIMEIVPLEDGTTLMVTASGIHHYDPVTHQLTAKDDVFDQNIVSLAVEDPTIYWYGTSNEGLVRHDLVKDEKVFFNKAKGIISNNINDVEIDKNNGFVYASSAKGISLLKLGYNIVSIQKNKETVYPNPFSLSKHTRITFWNLPPGGNVKVYSLNGNLVGQPTLMRYSSKGSLYEWLPSKKLSPGTYFYTIVSNTVTTTSKLLIVP